MGERMIGFWGLCLMLSVLPEIPGGTSPKASTEIPGPDPFAPLTDPIFALLRRTLNELRGGNVSTECRRDSEIVVKSALEKKEWALKFLDSMGKPSSGVMEGGLSFPGYYTECVKTKDTRANDTQGKYCLATLSFPLSNEQNKSQETISIFNNNLRIGVCVPQSCSDKDINQALSSAAVSSRPGTTVILQNCTEHKESDNLASDAAAIIVIFIVLLFIVFALVGTVLDWRAGRVHSQIMERDVSSAKEIPTPDPCAESKSQTSRSSHSISFNNNASSEALYRSKSSPGVTLGRILRCFSLIENTRKLLNTAPVEGSMDVLHGMRFLSLVWIVVGHSYSFAQQWLFFRNPGKMSSVTQVFFFQIFANGTFAVDTFFFLSGFLVAYVLLREMKRNDGRFNIPLFYLHRYIRLTPLMMIVIAICATVLRHLGSGPMWEEAILMYDTWCKENWWLNALYLQNFFHREHMCLSHTWYSAVDMQMYIVSPLIIYLCYRHVYLAVPALGIPFIITSALPIVFTLVQHLPALPNGNGPQDIVNEYYASIYVKPYCRMGPYLVGIFLAYFMHKSNGSFILSKKLRILGWVLAASVNVAVIFSMERVFNPEAVQPTDVEAAMYNGFARTAWGATIAWIAYACLAGYANTLNKLLSIRALIPLSRLTYPAYLIHPVIMALFYGTREIVFDYSLYMLLYLFIGHLVITYTLSAILSLLFESPIIAIERILRGRH